MCDSLYQLLLQYFDSGIGQPNRQEIELNACRYAIIFLVPATENRIVKCNLEYQQQYCFSCHISYWKRCSSQHLGDPQQQQ